MVGNSWGVSMFRADLLRFADDPYGLKQIDWPADESEHAFVEVSSKLCCIVTSYERHLYASCFTGQRHRGRRQSGRKS